MSYDCPTNHWRMFHDMPATFARYSHDVRPIKLRTFITIDRHTTFSRTLCDCRAKVMRLSQDGFARNDKPRKINILASIKTSDWEGARKELEGWKELDCWKVPGCWVVLDC